MSATAAILPVKGTATAKSRLGAALTPEQRANLFRALVHDTFEQVAACDEFAAVFVVTADPELSALATTHRFHPLSEPRVDTSHSSAALVGVAAATDAGFQTIALIAADCPVAKATDFAAFVRTYRAGGQPVGIVSDRDGTGTNALVLSPPNAIVPAFGPGSFLRHSELAASVGGSKRIASPALEFDLDTPADLELLVERQKEAGTCVQRCIANDLHDQVAL